MKKFKVLGVAAFAATLLASCATIGPYGSIYTDVTLPGNATANPVGTKVGTSKATSILGLIGTGNAGIDAAAKNGGISKISHVDVKVNSILGIYSTYVTYVYGN